MEKGQLSMKNRLLESEEDLEQMPTSPPSRLDELGREQIRVRRNPTWFVKRILTDRIPEEFDRSDVLIEDGGIVADHCLASSISPRGGLLAKERVAGRRRQIVGLRLRREMRPITGQGRLDFA